MKASVREGKCLVELSAQEAKKLFTICNEFRFFWQTKGPFRAERHLAKKLEDGLDLKIGELRAAEKSRVKALKGPMWKTKDGTFIPVKELTDGHLLNAIKLLQRAAKEQGHLTALSLQAYAVTAPDGAADAAERGASSLLEGHYEIEQIFPIYRSLISAAKKRKLLK